MVCIFADKMLLDKEYKHRFLERASSISLLKHSISGRYDKKTITDAEIRALFSDNHQKIFDFIGKANELRISHFFNDSSQADPRDKQVRLIDRFIIDSIHFDVINSLMIDIANEYSANQVSIDHEWETEIRNHDGLGIIPTIFIIQNAIKHNKSRVFEDLVFPIKKHVQLFKLSDQNITPNEQIFKRWMPELKKKHQNVYINYILFAAITVALALFIPLIYLGIAGSAAQFGAAITTTSFTPLLVFVDILIAMVLSNVVINSMIVHSDIIDEANDLVLLNNNSESCSFSTELMMAKLPQNAADSVSTTRALSDIKTSKLFTAPDVKDDERILSGHYSSKTYL